jgi:N-acyl-L-homoserine lactone synthetase
MKKIFDVVYVLGDVEHVISFGAPTTHDELEKMFRLRYKVYLKHDYIDPEHFENERDFDAFDEQGRCDYFIAQYGDSVIGSVRVIKGDILPIEEYFDFQAPQAIDAIERSHRFEISRLVVDDDLSRNFPRHIILLFLAYAVQTYAKAHGYSGAYAFLKERLVEKLRRLHFPANLIQPYSVRYPSDGVLYKYFNQAGNAVVPAFLTFEEVEKYLDKHLLSGKMFKKIPGDIDVFRIQNNMYTSFLKLLGVV